MLFAEIAVRIFVPYTDLFVATGRIAGRNPMGDWAQVDAFSAYRARPGEYGSIGKTVNRHGHISTPDIEIDKPSGTIRIVFLGGLFDCWHRSRSRRRINVAVADY